MNFYDLTKGFEFAGILSNTYNDLDNISLVAVSKYEIPVNTNFLTTLGMCFLVVTVEASPPELYESRNFVACRLRCIRFARRIVREKALEPKEPTTEPLVVTTLDFSEKRRLGDVDDDDTADNASESERPPKKRVQDVLMAPSTPLDVLVTAASASSDLTPSLETDQPGITNGVSSDISLLSRRVVKRIDAYSAMRETVTTMIGHARYDKTKRLEYQRYVSSHEHVRAGVERSKS